MKKRHFVLTLYVAGGTSAALSAVEQIRSLSEVDLDGDLELRVVDIREQPDRAHSDNVIATPTLIRTQPLPVRRLVGRFTAERILEGVTVERGPAGDSAP
jgi:circadian clock protein KaiB